MTFNLPVKTLVPRIAIHVTSDLNALHTSALVILENEISKSANPAVLFAKGIFGELQPKKCYPGSADGMAVVCVLPSESPKSLSLTGVGEEHLATHLGSQLSQQLTASSLFERTVGVHLEVSSGVLTALNQSKSFFVSALSQRSVQNKLEIEKSLTAKKNSTKKSVDVYFNQSEFSEGDVKRGLVFDQGMLLTRSLVNSPPNILNPSTYETFLKAYCAEASADTTGILALEVYDSNKLIADGCGLITAVGKGSDVSPRILKLSYIPKASKTKLKKVALVGKGITFDTGGLDIKPSSGMRNMKKDMGGSAAALGIFFTAARLNLNLNLTCYVALAENMISGCAMRPGDVYQAKNGISVEIDNTDAEGRLVLADALCYAAEENPDWIIDLATLTGAARVSLGPAIDSLFSNSKIHEDLLVSTGLETGDWVWAMPLADEYEGMLDSSVADVANSSTTGFAGSVTAALFLRKFVNKVPWSHIDTFMWTDKSTDLIAEVGATGKCVRLVVRSLEKYIVAD